MATGVLQLYHPCLLLSSEHTAVCRRRRKLSFPGVVARFVRRSEDHHIHLRLLTTLEIAAHRKWYDIASPSYKGLHKNHRIVCDTYPGLLGSGPLKLLPSKHSDVGPTSKRRRTRRQHVGVSCRRCRDVTPTSLCDRADELTYR